jgi:hypothetical protein
LVWVAGRPEIPILEWSHRYHPLPLHTKRPVGSALAVKNKLGPERIGDRTDGGLKVLLPLDGNYIMWNRFYYEVALEVYPPSFTNPGKALLQKTNQNKDGTATVNAISDPNDTIHAGQVFAEMLGAVCQAEFFQHTDIEVYPTRPLTLGLSRSCSSCLVPTVSLSVSARVFEGCICRGESKVRESQT